MNYENRPPTDEEILALSRKGFKYMGITSTAHNVTSDWLFIKTHKIYDLSAADLSQTDIIETKGLFIVRDDG